MNPLVEKLKKLRTCSEALEWIGAYEDEQKAWDECPNGAWLLWYCGRSPGSVDDPRRKKLATASLAVVRLAPPCKDEKAEAIRQNCLVVLEKWIRDEATTEDLRRAAADVADVADVADAADATANAAYAAVTANAGAAAAYADAAADAVAVAVAHDAWEKTYKKTLALEADEVRKVYPQPPPCIFE